MHEASKLVRKEELLNLLLLHIPLKQCAERLGISYQTVRKYASEPEFLGELQTLSQSIYSEVVEDLRHEHKTLQEIMTENSYKALKRLEELLQSPTETTVLKAADSILDRCPETARNKKVESDFRGHFTMDPVTLMHAAVTAKEMEQVQTQAQASPQQMFEKDGSGPSPKPSLPSGE